MPITWMFAFVLFPAAVACAQAVEVTPFAGYRFGSQGAASAGVLVNVPLHDGVQVEALFTHQSAAQARIVVDHLQAGGLQEFGVGRVRPYLTGTLGVSRYASPGDNTLRAALAAGGGVKLFPSKAIGVRLDGRTFATFIDVDTRAVACGERGCFFNVNVAVAWECEFFAGLIVRIR
jgi:hypothetical protein